MNDKSHIHVLVYKLNQTLYKVVILLSFGILYFVWNVLYLLWQNWLLESKQKIDRKHFQGNKGHIPHSIKLCLIIGCLCIIMHIKALDSPIGDVSKSHPLSYQLNCMLLPFIYVAYRCHLIDWHLIILYNMLSVLWHSKSNCHGVHSVHMKQKWQFLSYFLLFC